MAIDWSGQQLGPFFVEGILGRGAMGAVYRGRHVSKGVAVAIKVVAPSEGRITPTMMARFDREMELLKRFKHPNIVKFYGASEHEGTRYYAMELVEGQSLDSVLERAKRLPYTKASGYISQVCDALQEMHAEGVVHRDLKPANIMLDSAGRVKLTDFGIAKDTSQVYGSKLTEADTTVGTVAYMAPEQLAGRDLSRRSDLYSLGIMFYQMLTGRLPFSGKTVFEYINQRQQGVFPAPSKVCADIPVEFDRLICDMMELEPDKRPKDAYVVMQRLKDIMKAAKEGTLTKTLESDGRSEPELAATEKMETVGIAGRVKAITGSITSTLSGGLTGSGKRKKQKFDGPIWESPLFLVGGLLLILGFCVWMFWPLGEHQLFAKGDALMASEYRDDWDSAMQKYFEPLLAKYPDTKYKPKVEEFRDRIITLDCQRKYERAHKYGVPEDASEAFRKYYQAQELLNLTANRIMAQAQLRAISTLFADRQSERGWVLLSRQQLVDEGATGQTATERALEKRESLEKTYQKATELRQAGKIAEYVQICESVINLYGTDTDVTEQVSKIRDDLEKAKKLLKGAP